MAVSGAGETKSNPSGWSVDTLSAHLEAMMREADRRYEQRFDAQEKAVAKAETAAEKRLDSVNEFRAQLSDQAQTFMPRNEAAILIRALDDKFDVLAGRVDRSESHGQGRDEGIAKSQAAMYAALGALLPTVALIITLIS